MRDASFHGFDAACYAFGTILSLLEDGAIIWANHYQMVEERQLALVGRGNTQRDGPPCKACMNYLRAGASSGGPRPPSIRNSDSGHPRPCICYYNCACKHHTDHT
jgi:hypothetical protein